MRVTLIDKLVHVVKGLGFPVISGDVHMLREDDLPLYVRRNGGALKKCILRAFDVHQKYVI